MEETRNANIIFNKNGNGFVTTKITIPVPWIKQLGFNPYNKVAKIELRDNEIIIRKEEIIMDEKILKKIVIAEALKREVEQIDDEDVERLSEYITINTAKDGKDYMWYVDNECEAVVDMQGNIVTVDDTMDFFDIH